MVRPVLNREPVEVLRRAEVLSLSGDFVISPAAEFGQRLKTGEDVKYSKQKRSLTLVNVEHQDSSNHRFTAC